MWYVENLQTYTPKQKGIAISCALLSSLETRNFPIVKTKDKLKILYETKLPFTSLTLRCSNLGVL